MIYIGIDLGGKTVTGITAIDENENLMSSEAIPHAAKGVTPLEHRKFIVSKIEEVACLYENPVILFEKIRLFRGDGISPLANIVSLCKLQTTIIHMLSEKCEIYEVYVNSWKAKVLGSGKATKQDAIDFVTKYYPQINLEIQEGKKMVICHDQADSVCLSVFAKRHLDTIKKNRVNFQ